MERSPYEGKAIRCRGAVARRPGEPLEIEEIEVAPPKAREVRIKIICTSLCHSDVTFWKTKENGIFPRIFGHEAVGCVESVGENVEGLKYGDIVIPVCVAECHECTDCKSSKSNLCSNYPISMTPGMRDGSSRFTDAKGEAVHNFIGVSSFIEYTVVDFVNAVKIDSKIPPQKAALLGCSVSTGIGAAWRVAGVEKGSSVAIFGLGAIGLAVAEGARFCGASKIIGVDLNPEKFELGKKFGLTHFINPKDCNGRSVTEVIKEMTDGGADYCFECVGLASLMREAFSSCRKGWGKTIILGVQGHGEPVSFSPIDFIVGKSVTGSLLGGIKPKTDFPFLVKRYIDKELQWDDLITHEVCLKDINKAFDLLIQGKSLRCSIWMDS